MSTKYAVRRLPGFPEHQAYAVTEKTTEKQVFQGSEAECRAELGRRNGNADGMRFCGSKCERRFRQDSGVAALVNLDEARELAIKNQCSYCAKPFPTQAEPELRPASGPVSEHQQDRGDPSPAEYRHEAAGPPLRRSRAERPPKATLYDRPLHRDWLTWLTLMAMVAMIPSVAANYGGIESALATKFNQTAFLIDLGFAFSCQLLFFGVVVGLIRRTVRRNRASSTSASQRRQPGPAIPRPPRIPEPVAAVRPVADEDSNDEIAALEAKVENLRQAKRAAELRAEIASLQAELEAGQPRSAPSPTGAP